MSDGRQPEGRIEHRNGDDEQLLGVCIECYRARPVWPALVRGVAQCSCGSKSFTLSSGTTSHPPADDDGSREPLESVETSSAT